MQWIELTVTVERVAMEEVATLFTTFSTNGYIEEDLVNQPERVKLIIYGDNKRSCQEWIDYISQSFDKAGIRHSPVQGRLVSDKDWQDPWKDYIDPVEIIPGCVIKPAWKDYSLKGNERVYEIDSELAFGTGVHETTRACSQLLAQYADRGKSCLDVGTGTGILLLVADYLGLAPLVGIDIDEVSVKQAEANCQHNQVEARLIHGDLVKDYEGQADVILANLTVDPLKSLLPVVHKKLASHGILIISGIIDDRLGEIKPYIYDNWQVEQELVKGKWHTFALRYKNESL